MDQLGRKPNLHTGFHGRMRIAQRVGAVFAAVRAYPPVDIANLENGASRVLQQNQGRQSSKKDRPGDLIAAMSSSFNS